MDVILGLHTDDELVGGWTLVGDDWELLGNKSGVTRLGFAMLLKFFELEARFRDRYRIFLLGQWSMSQARSESRPGLLMRGSP